MQFIFPVSTHLKPPCTTNKIEPTWSLYSYIVKAQKLDTVDRVFHLVWLCFMAYQAVGIIKWQIPFIYIYIYDLLENSLEVTLCSNKSEFMYLHAIKGFQVLLSNTNSSIYTL